jgi:DNA-binding IclR family transcriptional regulator
MQLHFSFAPARVLTTALQLKTFSRIAAGRETAAAIARAAGASERGTRMLLDMLVAMQLLSKKDGKYALPRSVAPSSPPSYRTLYMHC